MRHTIFFTYFFDIIIGVVGITILCLSRSKNKTDLHIALKNFMICLMAMSLYDFFIYYTDYIVGEIRFRTLLRGGSCIIAVMLYLWVDLAEKIVDGNSYKRLKSICKYYVILFLIVWATCTIFFAEIYYNDTYNATNWAMLVSDVGLLLLFLAGSVVYIGEAVWSRKSNIVIYYLIIVSSMLLWNYISYFWGDASTYWGNSTFMREPLDLTILFWFIANLATLFIIYRTEIKTLPPEEEKIKEFNLDERLEKVAKEYELTLREKELTALIYEGKSNAEIARILFISESTVKTHIYNIFRKMSVKNRIQLVCIVRGES